MLPNRLPSAGAALPNREREPREMPDTMHPDLARLLGAIPIDTGSLLDVACGRGIIGALCRVYRSCGRLVGLDDDLPALEVCARHRFYDQLIDRPLMRLPLPFDDATFDVVTCVDGVGRLDRSAGEHLLVELERVARMVIITTPNGPARRQAVGAGPARRDRSEWRVRDFRARGYRVSGIGGFRLPGRGTGSTPALPALLGRYAPSLSEFLLCVRGHGPARQSVRDVATAMRPRDRARPATASDPGTPLPAPATRSGYGLRSP